MKSINFCLTIFLSLITFLACTTTDDSPLTPFESIAKSEDIVTANNDFAFSLFNDIFQSETETNFMISPASASLALNMVYNGADGDTKQAFVDVFNYDNVTTPETNLVNKSIIDHLTHTSSGTTFEIANSIWANNSFPVKTSFLNVNKAYYYAEVQNKDFSDPNTLESINNWVSNNTQGKLPKILNEISQNAVLYVINALYFKSDWKFKFNPNDTEPLPFHLSDGSTKQVDMMTMDQSLKYFSNATFSAVELPYKNDKYTMTLILPEANSTIDDVISSITIENWKQWQDNYSPQNLKLTLPKFTFSYEKQFNDALKNLGLGIAFSDGANFGGISDVSTKISFVIQKTFIEVNEKGTEAAAVTAVGIETTSSGSVKHVLLDKPFIFIITEKETGSICFMGKVGNPSYE
ncbi:serpin family protein [Aestuariivivens insulae]|uniref:serpin family protein n=1 Tax=Aestuariivivens insulae TaxID=1621988 RepID=UPI001F56AD34|nr:serpin family protein [Aestuariivivens insulae]